MLIRPAVADDEQTKVLVRLSLRLWAYLKRQAYPAISLTYLVV